MRLAQQFAMESDYVKADCIESMEFPELADRYRVHAVPKTVINGSASIDGSMPEEMFLERVLKTIEPAQDDSEQ